MVRTVGLSCLIDLNVADADRVLVKSGDICGSRVGQRVDVLECPERRVPGPRTLSALVGHTGDTNRLLMHRDERRCSVEQVERVSELDVLGAVLLADVERRADLLHLLIRAQRPQTLELGVVEGQQTRRTLGRR